MTIHNALSGVYGIKINLFYKFGYVLFEVLYFLGTSIIVASINVISYIHHPFMGFSSLPFKNMQ